MKRKLLLFAVSIVIMSCSTSKKALSLDEIFTSHFDHKMISSGNNFPDFNSRKDSLDLFLVSIHEQIPLQKFQKRLGWSKDELSKYLNFLESKNLLVHDSIYKPSIFIASNMQGISLLEYSKPISIEITNSIEEELYSIKKMYLDTDISKNHDFSDIAFFVLSNVLLDNWQINNVEREFLNVEQRPERHGKHYYYAIMENILHPKEEFGIYGNQYRSLNDSITLGVYGNNRGEVSKRLKKDSSFLIEILETTPRLSKLDNSKLDSIADYYKPKLIKILAKNSDYIHTVYEKTGYANSISFEEFFIWWYHFIYTDVTNMLAENDVLSIPEEGNFYYILER